MAICLGVRQAGGALGEDDSPSHEVGNHGLRSPDPGPARRRRASEAAPRPSRVRDSALQLTGKSGDKKNRRVTAVCLARSLRYS